MYSFVLLTGGLASPLLPRLSRSSFIGGVALQPRYRPWLVLTQLGALAVHGGGAALGPALPGCRCATSGRPRPPLLAAW